MDASWSGIRGRLLRSYLLLMLLTALILSSLSLAGLDWYYRHAITDVLRTQGVATQQFFGRIQQGLDLTLAGQDLVHDLATQVPARVQLYRGDGRLVGDSTLASRPQMDLPPTPFDVTAVLRGETSATTVGRGESGERALHLALPLPGQGGQASGVLRLSTSLTLVDRLLLQAGLLLLLGSVVLLLLTGLVGSALARTMVQPLADLTRVAAAMAAGDLGLRARVHFPDEVGRLAETLNGMAQGLGELDRQRSEFLRGVSHELRTPLTAIKAWAITLQDDAASPTELRAGLTTIEESTDQLARLVEDLLLAARLDSGAAIALRPAAVDAGEVVRTVAQALLPRARQGQVDLQLDLAPALPLVYFDRARLTQVVGNLLENALKFTPAGGRVQVALCAAADGVHLQVADTGVGIAPADLPRVTQRFFRAATAATVPGTGLGLTIVAELLERSGGRLAIRSTLGQGTAVEVCLPLAGRDAP